MTGNMTGSITCDLTEKMVIIRNIGSMSEAAERMRNISEMTGMGNLTQTQTQNMTEGQIGTMAGNQTGAMARSRMCEMTGNMVILRGMGNMTSMAEKMDRMPTMAERMDFMNFIDGKIIILEDVDMTRMTEKMDGMYNTPEKMDNITGKIVIIRNVDDTTQLMTKNIKCNITGNVTSIKNTGNMAV
jgi:hypothetical protein